MKKAFFIMTMITCSQLKSYAILYPGTDSNLVINEFLKLNPSDIKSLTGKKLSLKEILALKFTQAKIRTAIRKNRTFDNLKFYNKEKKPFKWHWGGFFLGLFLPFIGLLIAGIIKKDERKWDRINSAAIATAIISLVLIFIALRGISDLY